MTLNGSELYCCNFRNQVYSFWHHGCTYLHSCEHFCNGIHHARSLDWKFHNLGMLFFHKCERVWTRKDGFSSWEWCFHILAWILTWLWRDLNRNAAFSTNELFTAVTKFTSLLWNESFMFLVWYFRTWIVNFYMDVNASECVSCRN